VADLEDELVAFAQRLVQAPSLPGEEHAAQELMEAELRRLGFETAFQPIRFDRLRAHPAFGDDGFSPDGRVNVVGRWAGTGRSPGRSLILNGHLDVVAPGDEGRWSVGPWSGLVRDGRLWGRGACDMKSGLAAGVFGAAAVLHLGWRPAADLTVLSVVGEESGGTGALAAIMDGARAEAAVILEPTALRICPVQAGALTFRLTVPGRAAHGAMRQRGVSAIEKFALLHAALLDLERTRHARPGLELFDEPAYAAPLSIGTIRGGDWHSTVPEAVAAEGRYGVFPGEDLPSARLAFEHAVAAAAEADEWLRGHPPIVEWIEGQFESGATETGHPIVTALSTAHQAVLGAPPALAAVPYGSDLRLFTNHAGMAAVLYGPGDVGLAHGADECIPIAEVVTAARVIALLLLDWCGGEIP
jgi:acetylornithine deacetylase